MLWNLFAIAGELGTTNQYPWLLVVSEYFDVFQDDLLEQPPNREMKFALT